MPGLSNKVCFVRNAQMVNLCRHELRFWREDDIAVTVTCRQSSVSLSGLENSLEQCSKVHCLAHVQHMRIGNHCGSQHLLDYQSMPVQTGSLTLSVRFP